MSLPLRRVCDDWPRVLCPAPGCLMPTAPVMQRERVLHLSRRNRNQMQVGLARAFQRIALRYEIVDFAMTPMCSVADNLLYAASHLAPTLVWMQLQQDPEVITPALLRRLRGTCASNVVIVCWDGDQHFEPRAWQRAWFVDLGREFDAAFVKNTAHPYEYAALGVRRPGYLGQGADCDALRPVVPTPAGVPEVVFVANHNAAVGRYTHRIEIAARLKDTYGDRCGIYGRNWGARGNGPVTEADQPRLYSGARASLSVSIRADLPRYTSNRLLNILACGGVALVERFPDCAGLGLVDGENCLLWTTWDELVERTEWALYAPQAATDALRAAAYALSAEHSWTAYMGQLLAVVDTIRAERAAALGAAC